MGPARPAQRVFRVCSLGGLALRPRWGHACHRPAVVCGLITLHGAQSLQSITAVVCGLITALQCITLDGAQSRLYAMIARANAWLPGAGIRAGRHTGSSGNVRKDAETQPFAHDLPPPEVSVVEEIHALNSRVFGLPLAPKVSAEIKMPAGAWQETFLRCVCVCVCVCVCP